MPFDPEAIKAAAESALRKSRAGSNTTDQLIATPIDFDAAHDNAVINLDTTYLGLRLRCPLVASPGPISQKLDGIKQLAGAGVGAVVLYSLFEEQIRFEEARNTALAEQHNESFAEAMTYFPAEPSNDSGLVNNYLRLIERAAPRIDVPLIASLNGSTQGGWTGMARQMQDAGAAAIELNVYFVPGDSSRGAREVEQRHIEILQEVKDAVTIPVAMKLGPYFSSFGSFARQLDQAGADALVLFNRFLQPDIDLPTLTWLPGFGLSTPQEGKLVRTWLSSLRGHVKASLAATTGVETSDDVVKFVLAGADVVMTTSALVRHGAGYAQNLLDGLEGWLRRNNMTLTKARGLLANPASADPDLYARSGYVSGLEQAKRVYAPGV